MPHKSGHSPVSGESEVPWDIQALFTTPDAEPDLSRGRDGVRALFYEGPAWRGKETRIFAFCGLPPAGDTPCPAMVLVHGGGGTALIHWVQLWVRRGYAAIAMDTCGCAGPGGHSQQARHPRGGPPGWGGFEQTAEPPADQWPFHAAAAAIRAHSLIRSWPEVDADRIGLTGISWGGFLSCIVAGLDPRLAFAAPVYGCGLLGRVARWRTYLDPIGPAAASRWQQLWDPSHYLPRARCPLLWINGTNDVSFPLDVWQASYRLAPAPRTLSLRLRMPHGHTEGEAPAELHAQADALLRDGTPLARITGAAREGRRIRVDFDSPRPVIRADLLATADGGPWESRVWKTLPATLNPGAARAVGTLPPGTTAWFVNLEDDRGLLVSSEHEAMDTPA